METRSPGTGTTHSGPLAGLRVVDMTTSYAGPTATMLLADLGAHVVKVERPSGDDARSWGPPFVDGVSAWFASANRNKRSVVVDLRDERDRQALLRLIAEADVFVQNVSPGKLAALGLDPQTLRAANPRLVYCAISGFGLDGPDSALPGYDLIAQARSGIMSVTGEEGGAPQRVSTALSDVVAGICAVAAINAAVVRQVRTGEGDTIDISLVDCDLTLMAPRVAAFLAGDPEPRPSGGTDSVLAVYQKFAAADRELVVAIGNDAMWRRFCDLIGLPELAADPSLADNAGRRAHRPRLVAAVNERLRTREAACWVADLGAAGVPVALVKGLSEVVSDPHVAARGSVLPVPGSGGRLNGVHAPFRLASITEPRNERFPELGADTDALLSGAAWPSADGGRGW